MSERSNSRDFDCPSKFCDCHLYQERIWLNCTLNRLEKTDEIQNFFRSIPVARSAYLTITCTSPARSYLFDGMISHLSGLAQLDFTNCHFHDIPKDAFQGLDRLDALIIKGATLLGYIHPKFTHPIPKVTLLDITDSHLASLPPLCDLRTLRTLNVSYNQLQEIEHTGIRCLERPLTSVEILDVNYNNVSRFPDWLGESVPNLLRISCGDNVVDEVSTLLCERLPKLMFLDLSVNRLGDPAKLNIHQCSRLRILALGSNPMPSLPPGIFHQMASLQQLYLFSMGLNDNVWDMLSHLTYLDVLHLQNNSLVTLSPLVMRELSSLSTLDLSKNVIRDLPKKALVSQYKLKSLNLSSNGMIHLPWQAFSSLISLEVLDLSNNSISDLDQSTFSGLRSLKKLNFSGNYLRSIPPQTFDPLSSIMALDFSRNLLTSISGDAFLRMDALVSVDLSHNRILTVPSMSACSNLSYVDLSYNNITTLASSMFTGLKKLAWVNLSHNRLTSLSTKTFHDCGYLQYLDLSHNSIPALTSIHFFNVVWLDYLDLSYNTFSNIGAMFKTVKLKTLNMRGNNLQRIYRGEIPATVENLDLSLNQISHISPFTFTVLLALRNVNLTFNELTALAANEMEISFTQVVYSQPLFFLRGNPLTCDCHLGWLKDWSLGELSNSVNPLPNFGDLDQLSCRSGLVSMNNTQLKTLIQRERSEFLCSYSKKCGQGCVCCGFETCFCNSVCPRECRCYMGDDKFVLNRVDCSSADLSLLAALIPDVATEIFLDGNNLGTLQAMSFLAHGYTRILRLNDSDIHFIENNTFRGLQRLEVLYLQKNVLSVVYNQTFKDLEKLEYLYLQDNEISFIEEGSFTHMKNLKVLNLERNSLVTLSFSDFMGVSSLVAVQLKDNLWTCGTNFTCPFFQFLANSSAVKDVKKLLCYDFEDKIIMDAHRMNGTPVLSVPLGECGVNLTDFLNITREISQSLHAGERLSALIIVSVACVLTIGLLIVVYLNRHLLQVWCFTKFGWRVFKMAPGGEDKDRPYDAFVSYSNLNEEFVVQELAPRLENGYKHFKLCLHYRDFPVGASIAETIVKSVEASKRTIILVSSNFIESEWCKFEFQTAHQQVLTERKNRVIMILLHDIDESKLDQTLKLYMRTRTYLKYDDPWFWEKLMFAMPDKKTEKFERLPSTRDLEYMARAGRTPTKTVSPGRPSVVARRSPTQTDSTCGSHVETVFVGDRLPATVGQSPAITYRTLSNYQYQSNGHVGGDMIRNDMYEIPVSSHTSYERMNESLSMSSSLYNGSLSAGSGHYEEVTPRAITLHPLNSNCFSVNNTPPPLPPLPKTGLLPHEALKNSPKEMFTRDENWV